MGSMRFLLHTRSTLETVCKSSCSEVNKYLPHWDICVCWDRIDDLGHERFMALTEFVEVGIRLWILYAFVASIFISILEGSGDVQFA